jgi:hypothetical protein
MTNELTPEEITQNYNACLDSVWLINRAIANPAQYTSDPTVIERNVKHLETMRRQTYWTTEDMTPIDDAIAAGNAALDI